MPTGAIFLSVCSPIKKGQAPGDAEFYTHSFSRADTSAFALA